MDRREREKISGGLFATCLHSANNEKSGRSIFLLCDLMENPFFAEANLHFAPDTMGGHFVGTKEIIRLLKAVFSAEKWQLYTFFELLPTFHREAITQFLRQRKMWAKLFFFLFFFHSRKLKKTLLETQEKNFFYCARNIINKIWSFFSTVLVKF